MHPSIRRAWRLTVALAGWTLFVWIGRIRNALADASLSGADKAVALLTAVSFVVLGGLVAAAAWRHRRDGVIDSARPLASALAAWTVAVWAVRGTLIWFHDHALGFKVVHTVLAAVSIGLALAAARAVHARPGTPEPAASQSA